LTDTPEQTSPPVTRVRERVRLDRDESRKGRHVARWVLRGLLATAVAFAALHRGGASWTSALVIWGLLAAAVPAAVMAVPNKPPRVLLGLLWLGLGGFVALQVLPLPRAVVGFLQPKALEISDLGRAALGMGPASFVAIAVSPADAALQGAVYLLGACLALLGSIALSGLDGRRAVHWAGNVVLGAAVTSGLAWICAYTPPFTDFIPGGLSVLLSKFCFVNPNQESSLLNLGVAFGLSRMRLAVNPRWQTVFGVLALGLAFVVLEVGSRGGVITMCLVLTMTLFMRPGFVKGRRVDQRDVQKAALIRTGVLIASIALVAAVVALPAIEREFSDSADSNKSATMLRMIGMKGSAVGATSLLRQTWIVGAGPGGLPVLAGMDAQWGNRRFDFAENLPLDSVLSFGVFVGALFLLALAYVLIDMVRRRGDVSQAPGLITAVVTMLTANFVDFSLQLAGGLLPFLTMGTALERALGPRGGREGMEEKRIPTFRRVLVAAVLGLTVAGGLLAKSLNAMARNSEAVLQDVDVETARTLVAERFLSDHHAFYRYGRKLFDAHDYKNAAKAFDRAVLLWPNSAHSHLFRFATHLQLGRANDAADDLRWLLDQDDDMLRRAMRLCAQSQAAEDVLIAVIPRGEDKSARVAEFLVATRPDLVERVALALRQSQPKRIFEIEGARGMLYLNRGNLEPARRIAANLLANKDSRILGYHLEAQILQRDGKYYQAFHLFREVCKARPDSWTACSGAIDSVIAAKRPDEALTYLNSRAPFLQSYTNHAAFFWYSKGRIALQLDRAEDALEALRRAHGFAPERVDITLDLANTCMNIGLRDEARALVDEVLAASPKQPSAVRLSIELDRDAHHSLDVAPSTYVTPSILDP
jgi:tetratricopeptide (TPR) repeat protein